MKLYDVISKQYAVVESEYNVTTIDITRDQEEYEVLSQSGIATLEDLINDEMVEVAEEIVSGGFDEENRNSKIYIYESNDCTIYVPEWWD